MFRVNLPSVIAWMSKNSLLETGAISEISATVTWHEPTITYFIYGDWTINPICSQSTLSLPPESIRKPVFWCFQGVEKEYTENKWVKPNVWMLIYGLRGRNLESCCDLLSIIIVLPPNHPSVRPSWTHSVSGLKVLLWVILCNFYWRVPNMIQANR